VPEKKKADVATPSSAYQRMAPRWELAEALLGGTEAMRAAGDKYLPRHEKESETNYQNRLQRATLLNMFEDTVGKLSGKPFEDDMVLDVPAQLEEILKDVDLQGTAVQPFCRTWFRTAWAKCFAHVLVDMPIVERQLDAAGKPIPRTLEDDRTEGKRPYWVLIRPENVLAAYATTENGREVLQHVRILETSIERDGFDEVCVQRIKVLEPGHWYTWIYNAQEKEWVQEDEGLTGLDEIPLRTFYTGRREGLMEGKPPLTDLAHLNIAHWQSTSDQRNVLTVARFPILAASGLGDGNVDIGPNKYLTTEDPQGKWYYVEHTGAAIEAGRKDLEDLENQMASYGAEFMRKKPGNETATARALDSSETQSDLAASVKTFRDCVEECLQLTAKWMSLEDGGTVQISYVDSEDNGADAPELTALTEMRKNRDISRKAMTDEMKRRGVLSEDYDVEEDQALLDDEAPTDGLNKMYGKGQGTGSAVPVVPPSGAAQ
jgi:hypothetical protein